MKSSLRKTPFQQHPHKQPGWAQGDSGGFLPPEPPAGPLSPEVFLDAFDFDDDGFLDPRDFNLEGEDDDGPAWWG